MKIAVCIKRVPEMDVKFRIAPSGMGVDESGLKFDMADFDGYAVDRLSVLVCRDRDGHPRRSREIRPPMDSSADRAKPLRPYDRVE